MLDEAAEAPHTPEIVTQAGVAELAYAGDLKSRRLARLVVIAQLLRGPEHGLQRPVTIQRGLVTIRAGLLSLRRRLHVRCARV